MMVFKLSNWQMARSPGFTLIEILVAMVIMGISLGVLLAGFAQGHREAFRGDMAREAAGIAESVLYKLSSEPGSLSPGNGEIEGHPGWNYKLEIRDLVIKIARQGQENRGLEVPELREYVLTIYPPYNARPFVLTGWIPAENQM